MPGLSIGSVSFDAVFEHHGRSSESSRPWPKATHRHSGQSDIGERFANRGKVFSLIEVAICNPLNQ